MEISPNSENEKDSVLSLSSITTIEKPREINRTNSCPNIFITNSPKNNLDREIKNLTLQKNLIKKIELKTNKNFYTFEELSELNLNDIYRIFNQSHLIMFINNFRIKMTKKCSKILSLFRKRYSLTDFREITFLSFEFKYQLDDLLRQHNKIVSLNKKIKKDDETYKIIFDEGLIQNGILYRRLIVQDSYAYIPIDKYHIKITEYKIRGFCQIMEELGATKIEIDFEKEENKKSYLKVENNIDTKMIAGNLGFSLNSVNQEKNKSIYSLTYPTNNTIILNLNEIEEKIKNGDYLISLEDYNTNLELQYVINSRCRHYITTYSTTFTLKNVNDFDSKVLLKLGIPEISNNQMIKKNISLSSNLLITTNVIFDDEYREPSKLLSVSIPTDEIGFNFIMNNLKKKYTEMQDEWLVFIWRFLNLYVEKKFQIHHQRKEIDENINTDESSETFDEYLLIKENLEMIKENFSLREIIEFLKNYFDITSQMNNFTNFIKLLANKSKSYDSLGLFILLASNISEPILNKIKKLKKFLNSIDRDNQKIKEMLLLYDNDSDYNFYHKINKYGIFVLGNWHGIEKLLNDVSKYLLLSDQNHLDMNILEDRIKYFEIILNNYYLGYKDYIFKKYMMPFFENQLYYYLYIKKPDFDNEIIRWILDSISRESFDFSIISNYVKLEQFLENRKNKAIEFIKLKNEYIIDTKFLVNDKNDKKIEKVIESIIENSKNSNSYFSKKFNYVFKKYLIGDKLKPILKDYLLDHSEEPLVYFSEFLENFFHRIFCYNGRLNLNNIPLDSHGFLKIRNNIISGVFKDEIKNCLILFLNKYFKFHQINLNLSENDLVKILLNQNYENMNLTKLIENLKSN